LIFVEDTATNIVLGGNLGPLNYELTILPTNGNIWPSNNADLMNLTTNPVLSYSPLSNRYGRDLIKYRVNDGTKTSLVSTLTITILPVNDQPVISNAVGELGVVEVPEDILVKWTNFITYAWPGPWGEEKQKLTYYFKPADTTLFKGKPGLPRIVGTNTVLWFTPTNNVFGETLVELWAKDTGRVKSNLVAYGEQDTTVTQVFIIRITNVNDAPKFVTKPLAKFINEESSAVWNFMVSDIDTPYNQLSVNVTSTNLALVDPGVPGAVVATTPDGGSNWVLTVTPASNMVGRTLLTVSVSDGLNQSSLTVLLTVNQVNDAPTFELVAGVTPIALNSTTGFGYTNVVVELPSVSKGPANESAQVLIYTIVNSNPLLFALPPKINPVTGVLSFRTKAVTGTATLDITLKDTGGTANGGVATSAVRSIVINTTNP
jgi:hypothetical protein